MKLWLSKEDLKMKEKAKDRHFSYEKLFNGAVLVRNNRNREHGTYTIRHYKEYEGNKEYKMTIRSWRA